MTTHGPFVIAGENCANGANIAIEYTNAAGAKRLVIIARTVAVRAPWALHGHDPIEHAEAVANAHRIVAALNLYDQLHPAGEGSLAETFAA